MPEISPKQILESELRVFKPDNYALEFNSGDWVDLDNNGVHYSDFRLKLTVTLDEIPPPRRMFMFRATDEGGSGIQFGVTSGGDLQIWGGDNLTTHLTWPIPDEWGADEPHTVEWVQDRETDTRRLIVDGDEKKSLTTSNLGNPKFEAIGTVSSSGGSDTWLGKIDNVEFYSDEDGNAPVGIWHFNEGSGSTTGDLSGNGNDGTLNGPDWVGGIAPDITTPGDHPEHGVESVSVEPRIQGDIDQGTISLANFDGYYGVNQNPITRGDKVEWRVRLEGENTLSERWTGMVTETTYDTVGPGDGPGQGPSYLELDTSDFVFQVLADRTIYRVFEDEPIPEMIRTLVDLKAPEISTDLVDIGQTASVVANGLNLLEVVTSLAVRGDCVLWSDGDTLVMRRVDDLSPQFTISPSTDDISYPWSVTTNPDDLVNFVRVDGGNANALDDAQETQSAYYTVTNSDRLTYQLAPTRSRADRIELYTRKTGSNEGIKVRIQRDDGGAPLNPGSDSADIVSGKLESDDGRFADDGWSVFFLDDHVFHDENPWLIIESDGDVGQDVGVNDSNEPAFRSYYRYPIIAEQSDPHSQDKYRRIETTENDDSLRTFDSAIDKAGEVLEHNNEPRKEFKADAQSPRLQNLEIGDVVTLDFPRVGAVGDYILSSRTDTYGDGNVHWNVSVTLQEVDSL